jgi:hypothetical protein
LQSDFRPGVGKFRKINEFSLEICLENNIFHTLNILKLKLNHFCGKG